MSEWSIEHAWKAKRASDIEPLRSASTLTRSAVSLRNLRSCDGTAGLLTKAATSGISRRVPRSGRSRGGNPNRPYDVSPNGQRFLMIKVASADPTTVPPNIIVVLHFDEELKRLAATK